jgi:hypothetical protein
MGILQGFDGAFSGHQKRSVTVREDVIAELPDAAGMIGRHDHLVTPNALDDLPRG